MDSESKTTKLDLEELVRKIISDNWVSHWGNYMRSDEKFILEQRCIDMIRNVEPHPTSIILAALMLATGKMELRSEQN